MHEHPSVDELEERAAKMARYATALAEDGDLDGAAEAYHLARYIRHDAALAEEAESR